MTIQSLKQKFRDLLGALSEEELLANKELTLLAIEIELLINKIQQTAEV